MTATHGVSGYSHGCRCEVCRKGWRDYYREYFRRLQIEAKAFREVQKVMDQWK